MVSLRMNHTRSAMRRTPGPARRFTLAALTAVLALSASGLAIGQQQQQPLTATPAAKAPAAQPAPSAPDPRATLPGTCLLYTSPSPRDS